MGITYIKEKITDPVSTLTIEKCDTVLDDHWARNSFLVGTREFNEAIDKRNRFWSLADNDYTDTRMGASIGVNARPQFTRYSDIRHKGRLKGRNDVTLSDVGGSYGKGRFYKEAIDEPSETVYFRMGVPQFSSLFHFFSNAVDANLSSLARTGRTRSILYDASKALSTVAFVVAFPVLSAGVFAGKLLGMYFGRSTSKFYTLKPTMHLYWGAVNTILNTLAINSGILPRFMHGEYNDQQIGENYEVDKSMLDNLHSIMPDIFDSTYGLCAYAIANKAQRRAIKAKQDEFDRYDKASAQEWVGKVKKHHQMYVEDVPGDHTLINYVRNYIQPSYWLSKGDEDEEKLANDPKTDPKTGDRLREPDDKAKFFESLDANYSDGSMFAAFKVDHIASVQESFSNSVGESDIASKFNSISATGRNIRFNLAGGNIGDDVISEGIEMIGMAINDTVTGLAEGGSLGLSNILLGLSGAGFIDVPKQWQNSTVTLPEITYTTTLVVPYNNVFSRLHNLFLPISMLLATVLPLSTGKASYTSPFLVQGFHQGKLQVQTGIMKSMSFKRGATNLPFSPDGNALSIEVSFALYDVSSIMHMPLSTGSLFGTDMTADEDNILMDYLAVLAGQGLYDQLYTLPRAKLKLAKTIRKITTLTSPSAMASFAHHQTTSTILGSIFSLGSGHIAQAVSSGSGVIPK